MFVKWLRVVIWLRICCLVRSIRCGWFSLVFFGFGLYGWFAGFVVGWLPIVCVNSVVYSVTRVVCVT